ncbi:diguanylate cyclase domain-containing protein [Pseudomonas sp. NPDC089734]|uniref:diguanylate cyclase domain-containing protein n=1 Tax=Pseudomonas sp. NPDC089734 TaxID=3364469 RepID=UPI0037F2A8B8
METNTYRALVGFVDMLMDAICVVDTEGRYVYVSAACERIFGYTAQELIGTQMLCLVHPEDRARTLAAARDIMDGNPKLHFENRYLHKSGRVVHIMWSARWSEVDRLRIAVARDITELKRADSLRLALFEISEAANNTEDLHCLFRDIHHIIGDLLPARNFSVSLYDPSHERLSFAYHVDEQNDAAVEAVAQEIARTGQGLLFGFHNRSALPESLARLTTPDGLPWLGVPLNSPSGTIGALMVKGDIQSLAYSVQDQELLQFVSSQVAAAIERKQLHERLQVMAQYDPLTRLPNRMLLQDRLQSAIDRAYRHSECLAVLYLDLDKFKQVNDTLGHAAGDVLLQEVARRLKSCVRDSDTVARIGGDEFVVLLDRIVSLDDATLVADKIRHALSEPVVLEGDFWPVSSSIGIAHYPDHATDLAQLFRYADEAMYKAKKERVSA